MAISFALETCLAKHTCSTLGIPHDGHTVASRCSEWQTPLGHPRPIRSRSPAPGQRLYDQSMARDRRRVLLFLARVWAYPLWCNVTRSEAADTVAQDVDWWVLCINDAELLSLGQYSRFAYLTGALTEFRTLVHYRLRSTPIALRLLLRALYRPAATLTLDAARIGPALFIQHGVATIVTAETIGSHCWINQQVTIGYNAKGRPTLGDRVRVGAGAVVIGPITLHDGATVGANATVMHDVGPGETVVAPLATALNPRREDGDAPA